MTDKEIKILDEAFSDARSASRNAATAAKIIVDRIKKFPKDFQEGTPQGDSARAELTRLGNLAKEAATKEKEAKAQLDAAKARQAEIKNADKNKLEALAQGKEYIPPKSKKELEAEAGTQARTTTENYIRNVTSWKPQDITNLQQLLKNAGKNYLGVPYYSGPVDGKYNVQLGQAIRNADAEMTSIEADSGKPVNREIFFNEISNRGLATPAGTTGGTKLPIPTGSRTIYTPTEATSTINAVSKSILGREATPQELTKLMASLKKAQSKAITTTKYTMVDGVRVADTTGNLDEVQFLSDLIKKNPEYDQRKQGLRDVGKADLLKTAVANGLDLEKTFASQLPNWTKRIENGEDPEIFKQLIRQTAKIGLPDKINKLLDQGLDLDAVYAPYRNTMASLLEVNPDSISLSDPLLRSAIQGDKEMPIYDFQRQIRKDNRWQYTNNARAEASDVAKTVLRDFGFMG
jgi:peptidoglycan hydrolase-like protein with peptidoglycan-binding domain